AVVPPSLVAGGPVGAQEAPQLPVPDGSTTPDPRVHPDLWSVPTDGAEVRAAAARLARTEDELAGARERIASTSAALAELVAADDRLVHRQVEAERRIAKSSRRVDELRGSLRSLI